MTRFYSEAVKRGATRYFTGKPCRAGHIAERYTSTRGCCACLAPIATPYAPQQVVMLHIPTPDVLNALMAVYAPMAATFGTPARRDAAHAAAVRVGAALYVNGRPCNRGHVAPRFTSNRNCAACEAASHKRYVRTFGPIPFTVETAEQAQRLRAALITATVSATLSSQQVTG